MAERAAILAVDDDAAVRDAYRATLAGEFDLLLAEDGAAALALFGGRRVDLVLLDLLMPGLDGLAVLERLRAADAAVRVLVVTGLDRAQAALSAVRLGALDVVVKPFDPDGLVALVRATLAGAADGAPGSSGGAPRRDGAFPGARPPLPRVLVVGGEPGWRAALAVLLRRRWRVETASTLARALAHLAGWRPDLVVADLRAIGCPPTAAVAALRHRLPSTPLLAIGDGPDHRRDTGGAVTLVLPPPVDLVRLLDDAASLLPDPSPPARLGGPVARLVEAVSAAYATSRVDALADAVGLSASHLGRLFREQVGLTVRDYLARVRIEVARELLRETEEKTAAIAEMVGFCDESHLARVFRRHDGRPPGAYRRR
jgi:DNA-binding response OmpR family regulator/AraC-like DNA-binding protein